MTLKRTNILGVIVLCLTPLLFFNIDPLLAFIGLIGVITAVLSFSYPRHAIIFTVIYIPLESFLVSWIPENYIDTARILPEFILITVFMKVMTKRGSFKVSILSDFLLLSFITLAMLITYANQVEFYYMLIGARVLFRFVMIYLIVRRIDNHLELFENIYKLLVKVAIFEVVFGFIQLIGRQIMPSYWNTFGDNLFMATAMFGPQGTLTRYDQYGMFLAIIGIMVFARTLTDHRNKSFIPLILICLGVIASTSRQSLIMLIVGIIICLLLLRPKIKSMDRRKSRTVILILYVVVSTGIMFALAAPRLSVEGRNPTELITSLIDPATYDGSQKEKNFRMYFIKKTGTDLLRKEALGMGLGTFGSAFSVDKLQETYANFGYSDTYFLRFVADVNWITILGQTGIIGTSLFLLFFIITVIKSASYIKKLEGLKKSILAVAIAFSIGFIIIGFLGPNYEIRTSSLYLWLIIGLAYRLMLESKADEHYTKNERNSLSN